MNNLTIAAAALGLCIALTPNGNAQCGVPLSSKISAALPEAIGGRALPVPLAQEPAGKPRESNDEFSIVGLWNVNFVSGGVSVDQGFDLWNSDGTEILNDTPPPATGNICLGVWTKTGPTSYQLKHPSWTFDAAGNLNGTAVIREKVTLGPGADSFSGPFTVDVYDLNGKSLMHFDGTITGNRIKVD